MAKVKNHGHPIFMGNHTYSVEKKGVRAYGPTKERALDSLSQKLNRK